MRLLDIFQSFRPILCVCPCCSSILRLSDLHLRYRVVAPKTWLDEYSSKVTLMEKREERFEEKEQEIRDQAADRGRKKVPRIIRKSLYTEFAKLPYNPYDIKAILHPVDFIVFNGLNSRESLKNILFLSKRTPNADLNRIRRSIADTIDRERYDWKVARISTEGKIEFEEE